MLKRLGLLATCLLAAVCGCSSATSGPHPAADPTKAAAADMQAACAVVMSYDQTSGVYTNSSEDQMIATVQQDMDRAAGKDPEWQGFASDVAAYKAAVRQWRIAHPSGSGELTSVLAMWEPIKADCKVFAAAQK